MKRNTNEFLSLVAIFIGVFLGVLLPTKAIYFKFLGSIFLSLLKVLILPIIVLSLFLAIAKISDLKKLKSIGVKTIAYYFTSTTFAVLVGVILANFFVLKNTNNLSEIVKSKVEVNLVEKFFSDNIFASLVNNDLVPIILFVIVFSIAFVTLEKHKKKTILSVSENLYEVVLKLVDWVIKLAPIGILSLVWSTVSQFDKQMFYSLKSFFIATAIAAFVHSCITLPLIAKIIGKSNVVAYFWKVKEAIIVAFATASSAATLPVSTKVVENYGVSKKVSRFVLPLGATLNMDGSALYQAILAMLFISLSGISISFAEQIMLFLFIVLSSAGTAGIPSGGIVMMTMVTNLLGIPNPEYYLGIYILVDRFWDYPITAINVWGDLIGAKTVDFLVGKTTENEL